MNKKINKKYKEFILESMDEADGMPAFIENNTREYEERLKILSNMAIPLMKEVDNLYPKVKRYKKANECQRIISIAWTKCFKKKEKLLPKIEPIKQKEENQKKLPALSTNTNKSSHIKLVIHGTYTYIPDKTCHSYMRSLHAGKQVTLIKINHAVKKVGGLYDSEIITGRDYLIRIPHTIVLGLVTSYFTIWTKAECLSAPSNNFGIFSEFFS